jgi:peptidoglycan/xylan/chitin deacetylase (PgdA/CDA1 family)
VVSPEGRLWSAGDAADAEGRFIARAVAEALGWPGGRVALRLDTGPLPLVGRVWHVLDRYRGDERVDAVVLGTSRARPDGSELDRHAALSRRVLEAERRHRLFAAGGPGA